MGKMRVAQVSRAGGPFEIVEREIPAIPPGHVRIKVQACGVCHSDSVVKDGLWPGLKYPKVPGHEVIGIVDEVGQGVKQWKKGQRVGAGWHGGHCTYCSSCQRGRFFGCTEDLQTTGISFDGGYAEYMVAPALALAAVPEKLTSVEAAPLMCAGVTTYNALRNSGAQPGDLVAIHGLGGLGHLGVQYASKMGFKTVSIARGKDKEELALKLGAQSYIDSQAQNPAAALQKQGGAKAILATVTNAEAMESVAGGMGPSGNFLIIGVVPSLKVSPIDMIQGSKSFKGWYSGIAIDSQDTLNFSVLTGVRSINEEYPFDKVNEAYERMISGKARFRVVLNMGS